MMTEVLGPLRLDTSSRRPFGLSWSSPYWRQLPVCTNDLAVQETLGGWSGNLQQIGLACGAFFALARVVEPGGYLSSSKALSGLGAKNVLKVIARAKARDVREAILNGSAVVVDCRKGVDFNSGHIRGAVSLPVALTSDGLLAEIDKCRGRQLILYGENKEDQSCEIIASRFWLEGVSQMSWFAGGISEWRSEEERASR